MLEAQAILSINYKFDVIFVFSSLITQHTFSFTFDESIHCMVSFDEPPNLPPPQPNISYINKFMDVPILII
jgi:hypothetical protein